LNGVYPLFVEELKIFSWAPAPLIARGYCELAEELTSEPFLTPKNARCGVVEFDSPPWHQMCDICGNTNCEHELKHFVVSMLADELAVRYPKSLVLEAKPLPPADPNHDDGIYVVRPSEVGGHATVVLQVLCRYDYMLVYRAVPGYESDVEKVYAADPNFIDKIFDVLEGRRPIPKWS
jgi:hypothetical protein